MDFKRIRGNFTVGPSKAICKSTESMNFGRLRTHPVPNGFLLFFPVLDTVSESNDGIKNSEKTQKQEYGYLLSN